MSLFLVVFLIAVGVVGLGYVYHRWTAQTTNVIDEAANTVNTVIDDIKNLKK